ncbi:MAG: phospholipid transport system substrate-binding protein [Alteromonadaceae bacterium]|jgi:phospholipid transport system substrate-binding protein
MSNKLIALIFSLATFSVAATPMTPTESLRVAVDRLLVIAGDKVATETEKKALIVGVVKDKIDLQVLSQRVVSRHWKKANAEQKEQFIGLFTQVVVNTYFTLLNDYNNEEVEYLKENIKKAKYAQISTYIVMQNKKIPVTFKLIYRKDLWRIYDFSAEGVSMVSTYINDYKSTLKKGGLANLNKVLAEKLAK